MTWRPWACSFSAVPIVRARFFIQCVLRRFRRSWRAVLFGVILLHRHNTNKTSIYRTRRRRRMVSGLPTYPRAARPFRRFCTLLPPTHQRVCLLLFSCSPVSMSHVCYLPLPPSLTFLPSLSVLPLSSLWFGIHPVLTHACFCYPTILLTTALHGFAAALAGPSFSLLP